MIVERLGVSGQDLKAFIEGRLQTHASVHDMSALAREAHVSRNTLYSWFQDKTTPQAYPLGRVAEVLGVAIRDLWTAYGGDPTPQTADERRIVELIEEAYRRGYRDGWRDRANGAG